MSRLDSMIRRMQAQRACIEDSLALIHDLPGPILELGLGNGRTYDHLREKAPDREIFVFERLVNPNSRCVPDRHFLIVGDLFETLLCAPGRIRAKAALAHCDLGSDVPARDRALAGFLSANLPKLLHERAVVLSDQSLYLPGWIERPLPDGVPAGRYQYYAPDA